MTTEPLARHLLNEFDPAPTAEPLWNLPMAAAWAIWRDQGAVRRVWPKNLRSLREINPSQLPSAKPPSLFDVLNSVAREDHQNGVPIIGFEGAHETLWRNLKKAELVATGLSSISDNRTTISPAEWHDLSYADGDGAWPHDAVGCFAEAQPRYREVLIPSAQILSSWPSLGPGLYRTGTAGRPGAASVAVPEMEARHKRGDILSALGAEAKHLSNWLSTAHPEAPQANAKSMADIIRQRYHELIQKK